MNNKLNRYYRNIKQRTFDIALEIHLNELNDFVRSDSTSIFENKYDSINKAVPVRVKNSTGEIMEDIELFSNETSYLLIGPAGYGKTTFVKKLLYKELFSRTMPGERFPILTRSNTLSKKGLLNHLKEILIRKESGSDEELFNILRDESIYLIIDGIDESLHSNKIIDEINLLKDKVIGLQIIMTSRYFKGLDKLTKIPTYELIGPTYANLLSIQEDRSLVNKFNNTIKERELNSLVTSPLIFNYLFTYYKSRNTLPANKISLYKYIIDLVLDDWDKARNINRDPSGFDYNVKYEIISYLAYHITLVKNRNWINLEEDIRDNEEFYSNFSLQKKDINYYTNEITKLSGILHQTGFAKAEFVHKSIQEFLTADYLVKLPNLPLSYFEDYPEIYAIAVALSSNKLKFKEYIINSLNQGESSFSKNALDIFESTLKKQLGGIN